MDDGTDKSREVPIEVRRHIYRSQGVFVAFCAIAVSAILLMKVDFRGVPNGPAKGGDENWQYFLIAGGAIPIALAAAIFRIRRALWLASNGIEVIATVISVGRISAYGSVRMDIEYVLNGEVHQTAMSYDKRLAKAYRDGKDELVLLVDPSNPSRFMMKSLVFPRGRQDL
jgi:hypothetical protein